MQLLLCGIFHQTLETGGFAVLFVFLLGIVAVDMGTDFAGIAGGKVDGLPFFVLLESGFQFCLALVYLCAEILKPFLGLLLLELLNTLSVISA